MVWRSLRDHIFGVFYWFSLIFIFFLCFLLPCLRFLQGNHRSEAKILQNPMQNLWFDGPFATIFLWFSMIFICFFVFFIALPVIFGRKSRLRGPNSSKSYAKSMVWRSLRDYFFVIFIDFHIFFVFFIALPVIFGRESWFRGLNSSKSYAKSMVWRFLRDYFFVIFNDFHIFFCFLLHCQWFFQGNHGSEAQILQNHMHNLCFDGLFATIFLWFSLIFICFFAFFIALPVIFWRKSWFKGPNAWKCYANALFDLMWCLRIHEITHIFERFAARNIKLVSLISVRLPS